MNPKNDKKKYEKWWKLKICGKKKGFLGGGGGGLLLMLWNIVKVIWKENLN